MTDVFSGKTLALIKKVQGVSEERRAPPPGEGRSLPVFIIPVQVVTVNKHLSRCCRKHPGFTSGSKRPTAAVLFKWIHLVAHAVT